MGNRYHLYYKTPENLDNKVSLKRLILIPYNIIILVLLIFQVYHPNTPEEFTFALILSLALLVYIIFASFFFDLRKLTINALLLTLLVIGHLIIA